MVCGLGAVPDSWAVAGWSLPKGGIIHPYLEAGIPKDFHKHFIDFLF